MKKLLSLLILSVISLHNVKAQFTSLSTIDGNNNVLSKLHSRLENPNAQFRKYISLSDNGTYTIKGYTSGSTTDPDSYKGLIIPHLDINSFDDNLAYASVAAPGLPTTPSFKSNLIITKTSIIIEHTDNDIFLDSDWDSETGKAIKPKDPFSILWQCKSGQHTYDLSIILEDLYSLNCKTTHTCSHTSKVLPRTGRSVEDDDFIENSNAAIRTLPNGQKYKTGSYDAYPPVNFNHTQKITYSLTQMAQSLECTPQELAALIVYHGIKAIPLNKDNRNLWELSDMEKDILSYCLYNLFNLNDSIILAALERFNKKSASATESIDSEIDKLYSIQLSPATNADELIPIAKNLSDKCRKNANRSFDNLLKTNALNQYYCAQALLITAYALKKQYSEVDRLYTEATEYLGHQLKFFPHLRFYMTLCHQLGLIKEYNIAVKSGCEAFNILDKVYGVEKDFLNAPEYKEILKELNTTFLGILNFSIAADRNGKSNARMLALNVYRNYFSCPLINIDNGLSMYACELFFYYLIDELRNSLDGKPMNQQTAYFMGSIADRTKEFYNNYQLALETLNTYTKLYEEMYKKSASESQGVKFMQEYMKKNFYRTAEENAFDQKMLKSKYNGANRMIPIP